MDCQQRPGLRLKLQASLDGSQGNLIEMSRSQKTGWPPVSHTTWEGPPSPGRCCVPTAAGSGTYISGAPWDDGEPAPVL